MQSSAHDFLFAYDRIFLEGLFIKPDWQCAQCLETRTILTLDLSAFVEKQGPLEELDLQRCPPKLINFAAGNAVEQTLDYEALALTVKDFLNTHYQGSNEDAIAELVPHLFKNIRKLKALSITIKSDCHEVEQYTTGFIERDRNH